MKSEIWDDLKPFHKQQDVKLANCQQVVLKAASVSTNNTDALLKKEPRPKEAISASIDTQLFAIWRLSQASCCSEMTWRNVRETQRTRTHYVLQSQTGSPRASMVTRGRTLTDIGATVTSNPSPRRFFLGKRSFPSGGKKQRNQSPQRKK